MIPLSDLFIRFLKIGATAYGGPAIAGQMKESVVGKYRWMEEREFLQGLAFCQMLPGPIFIMLSAYIGYRLRGIRGASTAAFCFILPSFLLVTALSAAYFRWGDLTLVQGLFKGLGAIVVALILHAAVNFGRPLLQDGKMVLIAGVCFGGFLLRWNILLVFLLAAILGLLLRPKAAAAAPAGPPSSSRFSGGRAGHYLFLGALALLAAGIYLLCYRLTPAMPDFFLTLMKIGALSFGGAPTIIPMIQYEVVDRFQWVTTREFLDGIAMGQVTPGPISITAAFLGYKLAGLLGALAGTVAIYAPSFFLLVLLIPQYDRLRSWVAVRRVQQGMLAAFVGMLGLVGFHFGRATFVDLPSALFAAGAFLALLKKIDLGYILLAGAALSLILFGI